MKKTMQAIQTLTVSPSGHRVAFLKGQPESLSLNLLDVMNPQRPPVELWANLRCSQPYMAIVWSPDARSIYMARDDGNWFHDIWRVDVATG
ncbi:MAG: hypothetical protein AAF653_05805, partial [Chloroflexota bacterium]